jgi:hypothetical protein
MKSIRRSDLTKDKENDKMFLEMLEGGEMTTKPAYAPDYGLELDRELWSEVLPGLWQGGTDDLDTIWELDRPQVAEITKKDFDSVFTAYAWANPCDWLVKEVRFPFYDGRIEDIDLVELYQVVRIAHDDWKRGKKVLIRCQAGWNRSGLIMALVLMREGYTADEAINLIRQKRSPNALCNKGFENWLRSLPAQE